MPNSNIKHHFPQENRLAFSRRLKLAIKEKMTQAELAKAVDTDQIAVSRWANGHAVPEYWTLVKICRVLGISSDWLLGIDQQTVVYELEITGNTVKLGKMGVKEKDGNKGN